MPGTLLILDDWMAFYNANGDKVDEEHRFSPERLLQLVGSDVNVQNEAGDPLDTKISHDGLVPDTLKELEELRGALDA